MPLTATELLAILRQRWGASYDLQIRRRAGRLYFQVMWAYLEQQSFPFTEEEYMARLEPLVEQRNGFGVGDEVLEWVSSPKDKPRLGKALSFPLPELGRLSEFLL